MAGPKREQRPEAPPTLELVRPQPQDHRPHGDPGPRGPQGPQELATEAATAPQAPSPCRPSTPRGRQPQALSRAPPQSRPGLRAVRETAPCWPLQWTVVLVPWKSGQGCQGPPRGLTLAGWGPWPTEPNTHPGGAGHGGLKQGAEGTRPPRPSAAPAAPGQLTAPRLGPSVSNAAQTAPRLLSRDHPSMGDS